MGKYVKMLTTKDLQGHAEKDPDLAKFMADKNLNEKTIGATLEIVLPDVVNKWIEDNEGPEVRAKGREAFSLMFDRCTSLLMDGLPSVVTSRMRPIDALEVLADEVVECVYAIPFGKAGVPVRAEYEGLAKLCVSGIGGIGIHLSMAMICAKAHERLVEKAEGIPDIDPVLARKATHKNHATVQ